MIAPMHIAGFARRIERAAPQRVWTMIRQAAPDRDHFSVRGRIPGGAPEVAPARNDRAIPHDHRTEREVGLPRFLDRHAHETDIRVRTRPRKLRKAAPGTMAVQA